MTSEIVAARESITVDSNVIVALINNMESELANCRQTYDELYATPETIAEMSDEDVARFATETNKAKNAADAARKRFKAEWSKPAKNIEDLFKAELGDITELHDSYKAEVDRRAAHVKAERTSIIRAAFFEYVEANEWHEFKNSGLFERIFDPKWLNGGKRWSQSKAEIDMIEVVNGIVAKWDVLKKSQLHLPEATQSHFFQTLSLEEALEFDRAEWERRESLHAFAEQVEQNQQFQQLEPYVMEPVEQTEKEPLKTFCVCTEMTESDLDKFKGWMRLAGVHGLIVGTKFPDYKSLAVEVKKYVQ